LEISLFAVRGLDEFSLPGLKIELIDTLDGEPKCYCLAVFGEKHTVEKIITIFNTMLASFPIAEGHENNID
jgi:hypothetical protein